MSHIHVLLDKPMVILCIMSMVRKKKTKEQLGVKILLDLSVCNFSYFPFGFEGVVWVLVARLLFIAYLLLL